MPARARSAPPRIARLALLILPGVLGGCLSHWPERPEGRPAATSYAPAPAQAAAEERPLWHEVAAGETLYSISFRHGLDWSDVASWNRIRAPYRISVGQRLRLAPQPAAAPKRSTAHRPPQVTAQDLPSGPVAWRWPTQGAVVRSFSNSTIAAKGIDITGRIGQPVVAAGDGKVVYAGSGLVGYGRLIIVKHTDEYLSAYGHNRRLLVKEGDWVKGGQTIAELGDSGTDRPKLHFQIRKDGRPVDPQRYLPSRR